MKTLLLLAAVPVAVALAAPAYAQGGTPGSPATETPSTPAAPAPPSHHRNDRIEHDEILQSRATNAYELIQSRRSTWFSRHRPGVSGAFNPAVTPQVNTTAGGDPHNAPRIQSSANTDDLIVLLDESLMGGTDALKEIPIENVYSVEFVQPAQARIRFDRQTRDGAIVVHTTSTSDPGAKPSGTGS